MIDYSIVGQNIYGMSSAIETSAKIIQMAQKNRSDCIVIDGDGFGGGVVDAVREMLGTQRKPFVLEINSGKKANDPDKYINAKTEMWFKAAELLAERQVGIPNDHVLIQDLTNVKYYSAPNGRFAVESKKDIRKRTARSPDRADAAIYGWWAHQFVHKKKYDYVRNDNVAPTINRGGYDTKRDVFKWSY